MEDMPTSQEIGRVDESQRPVIPLPEGFVGVQYVTSHIVTGLGAAERTLIDPTTGELYLDM